MVLARRQHGFHKMYHRYRIGGCICAIRDVNEGPRIVIDDDIRDSTMRVFCRVLINRSSCITWLKKRTRVSETMNVPGKVRLILGGMRLRKLPAWLLLLCQRLTQKYRVDCVGGLKAMFQVCEWCWYAPKLSYTDLIDPGSSVLQSYIQHRHTLKLALASPYPKHIQYTKKTFFSLSTTIGANSRSIEVRVLAMHDTLSWHKFEED